MAGRNLDRRKPRRQAERVEEPKAASDTALAVVPPEKKAKKVPAPKKTRAKKAPPRMRARWGVFDSGMKQVAIFDYNQRAAADEKLADLLAKKKAIHFIQVVKEPMPELAAVEGPRAE